MSFASRCGALFICAVLSNGVVAQTQTATISSGGAREVGGKTLEKWMDDLKSVDPSVREEAIRAVLEFGPDAAKAVPLLIERCGDRDASPRCKAVIALGIVDVHSPDVAKVVSVLGARLQEDNQAIVRYHAAMSLLRFGEEARGAQAGLIVGARDPAAWEIRRASIVALRRAGRDSKGGPQIAVIRVLLDDLHDSTFQVRFEALTALGAIGVPADPTILDVEIRAMKERLLDRDKVVSIWAHFGLMALDKVTDKSLQAIAKHLDDKDLKYRVNAAQALGSMGPKAKPVTAALVKTLDDPEPAAVAAAAWALSRMEEPGQEAMTALTAMLKSDKKENRASAAQALGKLGANARSAVPALLETVQDKEPMAAMAAITALGDVAESSMQNVVQGLTAYSQRQDVAEFMRKAATSALEKVNKAKK